MSALDLIALWTGRVVMVCATVGVVVLFVAITVQFAWKEFGGWVTFARVLREAKRQGRTIHWGVRNKEES